MSTSVLLVDHCEIDRLGLIELLVGSDVNVTGHAWTANSARSMMTDRDFDVVIIDSELPDCEPIELLAEFREKHPNQPVVILSNHENPASISHAASLGASAYLLKSTDPKELIDTLLFAARGQQAWTRDDLRRISVSAAAIPTDQQSEVPLTQRESEVLQRLSLGHTNKEIAQQLGISYETVKEHVQHILRKIGVADRTQAAVWAVRQKLV